MPLPELLSMCLRATETAPLAFLALRQTTRADRRFPTMLAHAVDDATRILEMCFREADVASSLHSVVDVVEDAGAPHGNALIAERNLSIW